MLSKANQLRLDKMVQEAEDFIYDPNNPEQITFEIESYALKKQLAKMITDRYMKQGIFTEFNR